MILIYTTMPMNCLECPMGEVTIDKFKQYGIRCRETRTTSYGACEGIDKRMLGCPIIKEIPDNATNGDVIKALFSSIPPYDVTFDEKWWDAPYKRGEM